MDVTAMSSYPLTVSLFEGYTKESTSFIIRIKHGNVNIINADYSGKNSIFAEWSAGPTPSVHLLSPDTDTRHMPVVLRLNQQLAEALHSVEWYGRYKNQLPHS